MLLTSVIILMVVLTKEIYINIYTYIYKHIYKSTDPLQFIVNVVQFIESKM